MRIPYGPLPVIALLVLAIPTMGAACILLWWVAETECGRARAAGAAPTRDAVLLRDVGVAGTIVFATCAGLLCLLALQ